MISFGMNCIFRKGYHENFMKIKEILGQNAKIRDNLYFSCSIF